MDLNTSKPVTLDDLAFSDKRYLELKATQDLIVSWVKKIAEKSKVTIDFKELEKIS